MIIFHCSYAKYAQKKIYIELQIFETKLDIFINRLNDVNGDHCLNNDLFLSKSYCNSVSKIGISENVIIKW